MNWRCYIGLFVVLSSFKSFSQDRSDIINQSIEYLAESTEMEDADLSQLTERLEYYFDHPLNLNKCTPEMLRELGLLNEIQVNEFLYHRALYGDLMSLYELQSLNYWDLALIERVLPFLTLVDRLDQPNLGLKEIFRLAKFESLFRFQTIVQQKEGYQSMPDSVKETSSKYYWGNSHRYYTRIRYRYQNKLSVGITGEKDPGEQFFKGSQKQGFDFYSAHAFVSGGKFVNSVALGDYQVQVGQGLNLWTGHAFGKMADVTMVKKNASVLRPYTSVDENRFLRGAAFDVKYNKFSLLSFASVKKIDASFSDEEGSEWEQFVSSINRSGYHRTSSEILRKKALTEYVAGGYLRYKLKGFQVGCATIYQGYNKTYLQNEKHYNQFKFNGKERVTSSFDYSVVRRNFNFFGETSKTNNADGWANLHGVLVAIDSRNSMSLLYRDYTRSYDVEYTAGFSEGSVTRNEKGVYLGWKTVLSNNLEFSSYLDQFHFPWLKYQINQPSHGYEWLCQLNYKPSKVLDCYLRYRDQVRPKNSRNSDGTIVEIEDVKQRNYRVHIGVVVSKSIRLRSRLEYVTVNRLSNKPEEGVLILQDLIYKSKESPIEISLRYALFQTDSYDSRIYAYENNAVNIFSIPAYYYSGSRAYLLLRYSIGQTMDLWVRYGSFVYSDRSSLSSGSETIKGGVKSDVTIQFRIKL